MQNAECKVQNAECRMAERIYEERYARLQGYAFSLGMTAGGQVVPHCHTDQESEANAWSVSS